jgi:hypothetical protein
VGPLGTVLVAREDNASPASHPHICRLLPLRRSSARPTGPLCSPMVSWLRCLITNVVSLIVFRILKKRAARSVSVPALPERIWHRIRQLNSKQPGKPASDRQRMSRNAIGPCENLSKSYYRGASPVAMERLARRKGCKCDKHLPTVCCA